MYAQNPAQGLFCEHTLELKADYLYESTAVNESKFLVSSLHSIAILPDYLLISLGAQGFIVPASKVNEGSYDEFSKEMIGRLPANKVYRFNQSNKLKPSFFSKW